MRLRSNESLQRSPSVSCVTHDRTRENIVAKFHVVQGGVSRLRHRIDPTEERTRDSGFTSLSNGARYSMQVFHSRSTVLQSVAMNMSTSGDTLCQRADSTKSTHRSHVLVLGKEVKPSSSAKPDSVAFFDKETKRWKLEVGEKNM